MTDTKQTSWRSGDVTVAVDLDESARWLVWTRTRRDEWFFMPKWAFPDPQALAEAVDSLQPKLRYEAIGSGVWQIVEGRRIASCVTASQATTIAALLNTDEADQ